MRTILSYILIYIIDEEEQRDNSQNSGSSTHGNGLRNPGARKGSHDSVASSSGGGRSNSLISSHGPWRKESVTIINESINEQEDDEERVGATRQGENRDKREDDDGKLAPIDRPGEGTSPDVGPRRR